MGHDGGVRLGTFEIVEGGVPAGRTLWHPLDFRFDFHCTPAKTDAQQSRFAEFANC